MKRYKRSFIGLMEQNNEGEWVSYTDAAKLEADKQAALSALGTLGDEMVRLRDTYYALTNSVQFEQEWSSYLLNNTKKALGWYRVTVVLVIVILGVGLVGRFL